ncbi:MAG: hypothetical protein HY879_03665 [Deltaproteobacteria bacterium]|nr:hypothetical protein [Deltaproteobacteria bacterium]
MSFFARTDKPGPSVFGFYAYENIRTYVDAPSPGFFSLDVDRQWKKFTFDIREGLGFFADRSRFLLLTLKATNDSKEEKTLWIDEVFVSEEDYSPGVRLIDERSLPHETLAHRLQPGPSLSFTVDGQKRLRDVNRMVSGISFHRVAGHTGQPYNGQGVYTLSPSLEQAVRDLRLPLTRFYGLGDEPFSLEEAIDKAAEVCLRVGIPQGQTVLEFEPQDARYKLAPEVWGKGVRHSVQKKYGFRYWEIANEPENAALKPGRKVAYPSPDDFVDHFKKVSQAIRQVQPKAQIGLPISETPLWGTYLLSKAAGYYDFVTGHYYAVSQAHRRKFEAVALTENFKILDKIIRINELIKAYNPGKEVYQLDTEWGMHSGGPNNEAADFVTRNANIFGLLHRAVRLIYYAREGILRGAGSWNLLSNLDAPGFAVLSSQAPGEKTLLYWLYYYFNRHLGDWVLDMKGTAPYYIPVSGEDPLTKSGEFPGPLTPVLTTMSKDGKALFFVIANGSWHKEVPCLVTILNHHSSQAEAVLLTHHDSNGRPFLDRKEDAVSRLPVSIQKQELRCNIPPHSVVFITVRGK